jgi:hypothetical protein
MSTIKTHKMRKPAAIYRLIQRKVRGELKSPFWQVRVRISKGHYKQKSANTTHRAAAKEFARCWIAQDFEHLCEPLGIRYLERPRLEATPPPRCVTARQHRLPRARCAA